MLSADFKLFRNQDENDTAQTREDEDKELKVGYADTTFRRWPLNENPKECTDPDSAAVLEMEKKYMNIPPELRFENLQSSLPKEQRKRIMKLWVKVATFAVAFEGTTTSLKRHWKKAPWFPHDSKANAIMHNSPIKIKHKYKRAVKRIITSPSSAIFTNGSNLSDWKEHEKSLRKTFFENHKNFITALRCYYSALLEESPEEKGKSKSYILPADHPERNKIAEYNANLKVLDPAHAAMAVAKTAHHEQEYGRFRKGKRVPYVYHVLAVVNALIVDVVPHVLAANIGKTIEETRHQVDLVLLALLGPLHDLREDTEIANEHFDEMLKRLADKYDSRINQLVNSAFGNKRFKKDQLDLVTPGRRQELKETLRILSQNTKLNQREALMAFRNNIFGDPSKTAAILGLEQTDIPPTTTDHESDLPPASKTFQQFPVDYDENKVAGFLLRLTTIGHDKPRRRQHALLVKCEDRANNISTMKGLKPLSKRRELRGTVNRLIAYCMLDHDLANYPLYDDLPRLIDNTVKAYSELVEDHPYLIEDIDTKLIEQVETWQREVPHQF